MGKKGSDLSKNARQEFLLGLLDTFATGEGLTTRDIMELMNKRQIYVTIRTIYRDLEELSRFSSLTENDIEGERRWIWLKGNQMNSEICLLREERRIELLNYIKAEAI